MFCRTEINLIKFNAMHVLLLHDLATIVTLVPGPCNESALSLHL